MERQRLEKTEASTSKTMRDSTDLGLVGEVFFHLNRLRFNGRPARQRAELVE